jgi:hypothetical protein
VSPPPPRREGRRGRLGTADVAWLAALGCVVAAVISLPTGLTWFWRLLAAAAGLWVVGATAAMAESRETRDIAGATRPRPGRNRRPQDQRGG